MQKFPRSGAREQGLHTVLRILVATPYLPHQGARHGAAVYLHCFLSALAKECELCLISLATPRELAEACGHSIDAQCELVCHPQLADLTALAKLGHRLRMASAWGPGRRPLLVAKFWSTTFARILQHNLQSFQPEICLLELDLMAQYLPLLKGFRSVLTDHEAGSPVPSGIFGNLGRERDRRLWPGYIARFFPSASLIQTLTEEDAEHLQSQLGRPVETRPAMVTAPKTAVRPEQAPMRMLFLGDYSHQPNRKAARYLARELLPLLRATHPDIELCLAGDRADASIRQLGELPGVRFLGYVEDLAELLASVRCLVSPVFSGRGSRIKVLTALAHGLPVISNELGSRGISAPGTALLRGESLDELCTAVLSLCTDPARAGTAGTAARSWALQNMDARTLARQQIARFKELP